MLLSEQFTSRSISSVKTTNFQIYQKFGDQLHLSHSFRFPSSVVNKIFDFSSRRVYWTLRSQSNHHHFWQNSELQRPRIFCQSKGRSNSTVSTEMRHSKKIDVVNSNWLFYFPFISNRLKCWRRTWTTLLNKCDWYHFVQTNRSFSTTFVTNVLNFT